jgi:hypothetical protein
LLTAADGISKFIARRAQGNLMVTISSYVVGGPENSPMHRTYELFLSNRGFFPCFHFPLLISRTDIALITGEEVEERSITMKKRITAWSPAMLSTAMEYAHFWTAVA